MSIDFRSTLEAEYDKAVAAPEPEAPAESSTPEPAAREAPAPVEREPSKPWREAPVEAGSVGKQAREEAGTLRRDPTGRFTARGVVVRPGDTRADGAHPKTVPLGKPATPAVKPTTPEAAPQATQAPTADATGAPKLEAAPAKWKPEAQALWANLPPEVRAEVRRRESEFDKARGEGSQHRAAAEGWAQTLKPYEGLFVGQTPQQVVGYALNALRTLQSGPMGQRASALMQIARASGIPAGDLASAAEQFYGGQQPAQPQAPAFDPQSFKQELLGELRQSAQQHQQQQMTRQAAAELEAWRQGKEHFDDVRTLMGTIIGSDAQRVAQARAAGDAEAVPLTLDHAYALACQMHPTVAQAVTHQKQQEALQQQMQAAQRSRQAMSSVRGQPALQPPEPLNIKDRMAVLNDAWLKHSSGGGR